MKKLYILISLVAIVTLTACASNNVNLVNHDLFTQTLSQYVKNGHVNYKGLKDDKKLRQYLINISKVKPFDIKDQNQQLAFWINAYNAFTLKAILDHYPVKSIQDIKPANVKTIWDKKFFKLSGDDYSLNKIEHEIIRKKFKEPRIHFALVCAAVSCPPLRSEAYDGSKLDKQLTEQARLFLRNNKLNRFDNQNKIVYLSSIFSWFKKDFANNDKDLLLYISNYTSKKLGKQLRNNSESWKIEYLNYNWDLNE